MNIVELLNILILTRNLKTAILWIAKFHKRDWWMSLLVWLDVVTKSSLIFKKLLKSGDSSFYLKNKIC